MPSPALPAHPTAPRPLPIAPVAAALAPDGIITGYASLFDVPDMGGDVVARGAFADSLARRPAHDVRMLFQHDPKEPVGVWTTIAEDGLGLRVEGRLTLDNSRARDLDALIRAGAIDGLSIGFKTIAGTRNARTGLRRLTRIDLWEISIVTFPMLAGAKISRQSTSSYPRPSGVPHTHPRQLVSDPPRGSLASLAAAIRSASPAAH